MRMCFVGVDSMNKMPIHRAHTSYSQKVIIYPANITIAVFIIDYYNTNAACVIVFSACIHKR